LSLSQQQTAIRLALVFMLFEGLIALAVVFFLLLPMAQRAASDLAGLMVLSGADLERTAARDTARLRAGTGGLDIGLFLAEHPPAKRRRADLKARPLFA
jgi:hypothetical protein